MVATTLWIVMVLTTQTATSPNPVLQALLDVGIEANGAKAPLLPPTLADGQSAEVERAVLKRVAGDDRSVENFVRDSVTAPFVLKTRDVKAGDATIRGADLYFVVRGRLDEIDLKQVLGKTDASTVEAGNMRVSTKVLQEKDLSDRKVDKLPPVTGRDEWYTHASGRLLDRITFEATDHAVATRTADSLTVASATSRPFDADPTYPNRWSTLSKTGSKESAGEPQVYVGNGSYAKITRLSVEPGALFVEAHFAFVEPFPWFQGSPILRSKFSLICQDQVRQLRREIQKRRTEK